MGEVEKTPLVTKPIETIPEAIIPLVMTPVWYLKIKSKITRRRDRSMMGVLVPLAISALVVFFIWKYFLQTNLYQGLIIVSLVILFFLFFYYISLKLYVTRNAKFDDFDFFAYICGSIGLDLDRLSVIPDYNHYLAPNTTAFITNAWTVRRKYKGPDYEPLRKSLKELSKNIDKIYILLKNPKANAKTFSDLSDKFLDLGRYIINDHKPRIDASFVNRITTSLLDIEVEGERITAQVVYEVTKKIVKSRNSVILVIDVFISVGIYFLTVRSVGMEWAIEYAIAVFFGIPIFIAGFKRL